MARPGDSDARGGAMNSTRNARGGGGGDGARGPCRVRRGDEGPPRPRATSGDLSDGDEPARSTIEAPAAGGSVHTRPAGAIQRERRHRPKRALTIGKGQGRACLVFEAQAHERRRRGPISPGGSGAAVLRQRIDAALGRSWALPASAARSTCTGGRRPSADPRCHVADAGASGAAAPRQSRCSARAWNASRACNTSSASTTRPAF